MNLKSVKQEQIHFIKVETFLYGIKQYDWLKSHVTSNTQSTLFQSRLWAIFWTLPRQIVYAIVPILFVVNIEQILNEPSGHSDDECGGQ